MKQLQVIMKTVIKVNEVENSLKARIGKKRRMNESVGKSAGERSLENSWMKDLRSTG